MDWSTYYPAFVPLQPEGAASQADGTKPTKLKKDVEVADIGCGFGGLLVALAPKLPDVLLLGTYVLEPYQSTI